MNEHEHERDEQRADWKAEQRQLRWQLDRIMLDVRARIRRDERFIGGELLASLAEVAADLGEVETCLRLDMTPTESEIDGLWISESEPRS